MKVPIHAGQRFLERVMLKGTYTCFDVNRAIEYLEKVLRDVVPSRRSMHFVLPGFEKFKVVCVDNTIVTIIPKGAKHGWSSTKDI